MIEVKELSVFYNESTPALENISFTLEKPAIVGIIGPNGAGKSTLIKAMLHIINHKGKTLIDKHSAKRYLKKIAYVEQKSDVDYTFPIKVKECVSLGTYSSVGVMRKLKSKDWERVFNALDKVGLSSFAERQISELSGGQFQRVLLARCLVQEADYIFLDEPFVGIDSISERIIMEILDSLKEEGKIILIVHHDLSKVKSYFDEVIIINKNLINYGETDETFTGKNLIKAYGEGIFVGGITE
ncbi:metal ABC transporter ATP-binding protein [Enterococcus sp. DIV1420a]|uniref:metal ABC transporter ATP-binding protein n=1 Tax=Enterococcus sp. DIV1420a TaxID=2774672 RepID=UPI003F2022DD